MPRRFFRRLSARFRKDRDLPGHLRPFRDLLRHPMFFAVNRRSVAGAIWVGLFMALLPVPGQTILAPLLALVLRVNLPIAALSVWLTNPVTMLPIFYAEYRLGAWLLDQPLGQFPDEISLEWFQRGFTDVWIPLMLGSMIVATVVASSAYVTVNVVWRAIVSARYRRRRALSRSSEGA